MSPVSFNVYGHQVLDETLENMKDVDRLSVEEEKVINIKYADDQEIIGKSEGRPQKCREQGRYEVWHQHKLRQIKSNESMRTGWANDYYVSLEENSTSFSFTMVRFEGSCAEDIRSRIGNEKTA